MPLDKDATFLKEQGFPGPDVPADPTSPINGQWAVPHYQTFAGIVNQVSRTYRYTFDAATTHSDQNKRTMRNDPLVWEPLRTRQYPTAQLAWHLEPLNQNDQAEVEAASFVTDIINQTPRFQQLKMALLEALWYGRYGAQLIYQWEVGPDGTKVFKVRDHRPINGDKITFKWSNEAGVLVNQHFPGDWEVTDRGRAHFFSPAEREQVILHRHEPEDADFLDPDRAGAINGIGLRGRIYWIWWLRAQVMAWMMDYLERVGAGGFTIYYYEAGNPQSLSEVQNVAQTQITNNVVLFPRYKDNGTGGPGIQRVEPSNAGAGLLGELITGYFDVLIRRTILGQNILGERSGGLSIGEGIAQLDAATFSRIVKYDAVNLGETLTEDFVKILYKYNRPNVRPARFVFDVDKPNAVEVLEAARYYWEMGGAIDGDHLRSLIGLETPEPDHEVLAKLTPVSPAGVGASPAGVPMIGPNGPAPEDQPSGPGSGPESGEAEGQGQGPGAPVPTLFARQGPKVQLARGLGSLSFDRLGELTRWLHDNSVSGYDPEPALDHVLRQIQTRTEWDDPIHQFLPALHVPYTYDPQPRRPNNWKEERAWGLLPFADYIEERGHEPLAYALRRAAIRFGQREKVPGFEKMAPLPHPAQANLPEAERNRLLGYGPGGRPKQARSPLLDRPRLEARGPRKRYAFETKNPEEYKPSALNPLKSKGPIHQPRRTRVNTLPSWDTESDDPWDKLTEDEQAVLLGGKGRWRGLNHKKFLDELEKSPQPAEELAALAKVGRLGRKWYHHMSSFVKHLYPQRKEALRFAYLNAATSPRVAVVDATAEALDHELIYQNYLARKKEQGQPTDGPADSRELYKELLDVWHGTHELNGLPRDVKYKDRSGRQVQRKKSTIQGLDSDGQLVDQRLSAGWSMPAHYQNVLRILSHDWTSEEHPWISGLKVSSFGPNVFGDYYPFTFDVHMADASGRKQKVAEEIGRYLAHEAQARHSTDLLNRDPAEIDFWTPAELQASNWVVTYAVKALHKKLAQTNARQGRPAPTIRQVWARLTNKDIIAATNTKDILQTEPIKARIRMLGKEAEVAAFMKHLNRVKHDGEKLSEKELNQHPAAGVNYDFGPYLDRLEKTNKLRPVKGQKRPQRLTNETLKWLEALDIPGVGLHMKARGPKKQYAAVDPFTPDNFSSMVFLSENPDHLNFAQAQERMTSDHQRAFRAMTDDILRQLGHKDYKTLDAIGDWADGAENSVLQIIHGRYNPETVTAAAAWYGLLGNQKSVLQFFSDPEGPDSVYQVVVPDSDTQRVRSKLDQYGIKFRTLVPTPQGHLVVVYDQGRLNRQNIAQFAGEYRATVSEAPGSGEYIGGDTREEAHSQFRSRIREYEFRRAQAQTPGPISPDPGALRPDLAGPALSSKSPGAIGSTAQAPSGPA